MRKKTIFSFSGLIKGGLTVLISVLIIYGVVCASTDKITPPTGTPVANFYSLSEIYNFITANTVATAGSPALDWSVALEDTQYTLTEIYEELRDLIAAGQVKKDTIYLGVTGTLYGDIDPTKVLTVASAAGSYNAANLTADKIKLDVVFGASGETGTLAPDGAAAATDCLDTKTFYSGNSWTQKTGSIANCSSEGGSACYAASGYWTASAGSNVTGADGSISFSIPNGYYSSKTCTVADSDLAVGNIKSGVTILGSVGEYPSATYTLSSASATADLAASGNNISSSNGAVEWWQSDGTRQTATLDFPTLSNVCSGDTSNNSAGTLSVTAAYLSVGNTWCGTAGTLLANLFNGSLTAGGFSGGSQTNGGVDDYNAGNAAGRPTDSYSKGWTSCTSGADNYCGTNDPFADMKDNSTGLVWSKPCSGSGCSTSAEPADTNYSWDGTTDASNNSLTASVLCSQDLGTTHDAGWSLPHQKQLMQAYIDGSYGNLEASGVTRYYWSGTTKSDSTTGAWSPSLSNGYTTTNAKTNSYYVRCVRSAN